MFALLSAFVGRIGPDESLAASWRYAKRQTRARASRARMFSRLAGNR